MSCATTLCFVIPSTGNSNFQPVSASSSLRHPTATFFQRFCLPALTPEFSRLRVGKVTYNHPNVCGPTNFHFEPRLAIRLQRVVGLLFTPHPEAPSFAAILADFFVVLAF
jgi:hypothetical protein